MCVVKFNLNHIKNHVGGLNAKLEHKPMYKQINHRFKNIISSIICEQNTYVFTQTVPLIKKKND